jgi:hypothetical protein
MEFKAWSSHPGFRELQLRQDTSVGGNVLWQQIAKGRESLW